MKTSAAGRAAITQREGCRLTAYRDSVGVWTIGVGHTGRAALPLVVPGMTITAQAADEIFARDLIPFEAAVNSAAPRGLTQSQFDACVSLAFNIGDSGFAKSTVARKLASGDMAGAADAFLLWNKPPEIMGRRRTERLQFLTPAASPSITPVAGAPVLNAIIGKLNEEAAKARPTVTIPPAPIGPHNPAKPQPRTGLAGWWDRITGKV